MALHALQSPSSNSRWGNALRPRASGRLAAVGAALRRPASVALSHIQEHGYFFAAAGCADAAGFDHSTFAGLIVSAATFLAIEWRVSKRA